jgi:hypothetical protein
MLVRGVPRVPKPCLGNKPTRVKDCSALRQVQGDT